MVELTHNAGTSKQYLDMYNAAIIKTEAAQKETREIFEDWSASSDRRGKAMSMQREQRRLELSSDLSRKENKSLKAKLKRRDSHIKKLMAALESKVFNVTKIKPKGPYLYIGYED
jgi:ferric-dicitrate binding protein FerR (iron transport regulator)